ncbi:MAG: enoyl-CoA hydratase-related protein, partial [Wenzhouxiangellaceae bacterium]
IGELRKQQPVAAEQFSRVGQRLMRRIERMPVPVIAAINGYALGGGLELALACHIRMASESAQLGLPEIKLGLLPGFGGTQRLTRAVGRGQATLMMLGGDPIDAASAQAIGLVQKIVAADALLDDAIQLAESLAGQAPLAVTAILDAVDRGLDMPLDAALDYESARFGLLCASDDMREGTSAFLEKRKPAFSGR